MSDFEKCPCGERAARYCRACSTKKCMYCMTGTRCLPCQDKKNTKSLEALNTKTEVLLQRMDALRRMWRDFDTEVMHDDKFNDKAVLPLHLLTRATELIRESCEETKKDNYIDESITTEQLAREKE